MAEEKKYEITISDLSAYIGAAAFEIVDIWAGRKRRRWLCNGYCRTAGSSSICICRHSEDRSLRGREDSSSF